MCLTESGMYGYTCMVYMHVHVHVINPHNNVVVIATNEPVIVVTLE